MELAAMRRCRFSMKIFSQYNIIARVFPTMIGLIPFFIFQYVFLNNVLSIDSVVASIVGNIGLSTILLYTFNQYFVRVPSKIFEDWLFGKQLYFPTTTFLLYSDNEYSEEFKDKVRDAVKFDFSIQLPNKVEEQNDVIGARKKVKEAVRLIIGKVKDGYLVLQHNIEYGFVRNLWGASLVGIAFSLILVHFSIPTSILGVVAATLFYSYIFYVLLGFLVIKYFGKMYARKLIEEYFKISYEN